MKSLITEGEYKINLALLALPVGCLNLDTRFSNELKWGGFFHIGLLIEKSEGELRKSLDGKHNVRIGVTAQVSPHGNGTKQTERTVDISLLTGRAG